MPAEEDFSASPLSSKMRAYMAEIYRLLDRQAGDAEFVSSSQLAELSLGQPARGQPHG